MNLYTASSGLGKMEQLAVGDSPLHRLPPMVKLITTLVYIVAVISFPINNVSGLTPYIFYPACLMPVSGTPAKPFFARMLVALPFALLGGVSNLFILRDTAFMLGGLAVTDGLISFVSIMLKMLLTVSAVLLLAATTPFTHICRALSQLRLPGVICLQLLLTYRYIAVLIGEMITAVTAYRLRSPLRRGIHIRHIGSFLGVLLLRSMERADRVYQAMLCRGFDGTWDWVRGRRAGAASLAYAAIIIALCVLLRFFDLSEALGNLFVG
ncbi:MAG: cobalt ECF transporter T component CbiQ [Clostridiales Family XIII bacterium]|jgi:cobalt/nickel transport system permease protein|nr:cobalt ECF transporter T component CbiQ [Clostridiales Family XIII bacterium]